MIGIGAVAGYIPERRESNFDKKEMFSITDDFIEGKLGVHMVARKSDEQDTSDLCVEAFNSLATKTNESYEDVDCVVVCTQNPDKHGIPHTSAVVHGKLNLSQNCAVFDIGLGCSGYVYSLSVMSSFMQAQGLKKGLLFTADPYSKILNPEDKNTVVLFGDAASVTLLKPVDQNNPGFRLNRFSFGTCGQEGEALQNHSGRLKMKGRAVFNFTVKQVPNQIEQVLKDSHLKIEEVDQFLLHQGSKFLINHITQRLHLDPTKVPFLIKEYGNTVSSSIPLLLEKTMDDAQAKRVLISGFGVGLSWATGILERL